MKNDSYPEIRFQGFKDAWEQRKLDDMCSIITKQTGFDYSSTIKPSLVTTKETDTYSFIQNKDFEGLNINLNTDFYIPISVAEKYPKITLDQPSLLISISGRIGNIALYSLPEKAFIGGAVGICKLNDVDAGKTAMYELLSPNGQKYFASLIKASSHANITVEDIRNIEVFLPKDKEEIIKLNTFMDNLNNLITLHQRKHEKLKNIKQAMLEKMFPKNGEKFPEIRFQGFTDAWEQCKLSKVYKNISNAFVGTASPYYVDHGHFYLESNNIKDGQINYRTKIFINDEFYQKQKDKWLHTGDMVMVQSGHVGHAAVIPEELDNTAAHALIMFKNPNIKIDPYFLNYQYQTFKAKKKIEYITIGNTIKHILASDMQEFVVDVTSYEEQSKIAMFFQQLDNLITLHQRKHEKLKNIKQAMLGKMFI